MLVSILIFVCASAYVSLSFIPVCKGGQVMRLFIVVLALAVTASTQAMAVAPLHQRHAKMTRQAEGDGGCGTNRHRGISGACVLNPTKGPYKPDPYWLYCDYSSVLYPEGCGE
jgi:hypothetical protein